MDSSSLQESKAIDPKNSLNPSSKHQKSIAPPSHEIAPPPSSSYLVDFPALPPPISKPPVSNKNLPLVVIGAVPIPSQPPKKPVQPLKKPVQPPPSKVSRESAAAPIKPSSAPATLHRSAPPAAPVMSKTVRAVPGVLLQPVPASSLQQPLPKTVQQKSPQEINRSPRTDPLGLLNASMNLQPLNQMRTTPTGSHDLANSNSRLESSKLFDAYTGKFDFKPRHQIKGIPCLSFFEVEKSRLLTKVQNIVIVKFSHNRPKYVDFRLFLDNKKFAKSYRIVEFDKKHVFIIFESFQDFVKLWVMKSVVIKGFKARFFSWDENFNPSIESFVAPVWIHLPGLPLFMFDEDVILSIGALFGKILYIDPACLNKDKIGVLSFCVSMDVREEKLVEFWVEFVGEGIHVTRFLQRVVYGDIPSFCSSCKHLGHSFESCKVLEAVDLRDKLKGKKVAQEVDGNGSVIPTVSVFKRLGVLSAPTKGKELGESSTARGSILEEVEVVDITDEEEIELAKQNSATFAVREPSLEPHNSLGSNNGAKGSGVLDTRVNKLRNGSRFGPLAAVNEEETAVENRVLQEKSAVCVEKATLTSDISLTRPEEEGSPSATQIQVIKLQNPEEMGVKLSLVCPESDLEKQVLQNSAADSDEEATLLADFSQLVHGGSVIPSGVEIQVARLQESEEIKAIAAMDCPERRFEVGVSLQSAAVFADTPTLRAHISSSRDNQDMTLSAPESSLPGLQNGASLNMIAEVSEELSSDESGVSTYAATTSNEHNFCSRDDTDLILGPTESREDYLQVQGEKQVSNMLINQVYPSKVIITHPVTKEVIVLPPSSQSLCAPAPKSALEGMSKNEKKKWRKKQKREAEKKGKSVVEPIVLAEPIASPPMVCQVQTENWETLDSNASKDTPFWTNFHAAQKDASLFAGLDAHPYMFMLDSEDELSTGSSIPKHSRMHPTYKARKERDRSLDYLDLQPTSAKGTFLEKTSLPTEPSKVTEELVTPSKPISTSWALEVEEQDAEDAREIYTLEEMTLKIVKNTYDELPFADSCVEELLRVLVPKHIALHAAGCPKNDVTIAKVVNQIVISLTGGSPEKTPIKPVADLILTASKARKEVFEPP